MNKYPERKPNRLKEYDYSQFGYYYVTICVQNREYIFGDISDDGMILNQCGDMAKNSWLDLANHHKNIQLDSFVIMPNHIHGIIIINNPVRNKPACSVNKNNNLSVIIGSYKSTATKQINRINNIAREICDNDIKQEKELFRKPLRTKMVKTGGEEDGNSSIRD